MLFAALWLTVAAADPTPAVTLPELLRVAGESETRKTSGSCVFTEDSVTEQLDDDGKVEGSVTRRAETTVKDGKMISRNVTSKKVEGSPSSMMQKEQREPKPDEPPPLSPFHPKAQELYTFQLEGPADGDTVKIRFAPKEKNERRLKGVATIDTRSGLITHMEGSPSDLPIVVDRMELSFDEAETPCGPQVTHLTVSGKAGVPFFKTRFRSETTLSGHHRP